MAQEVASHTGLTLVLTRDVAQTVGNNLLSSDTSSSANIVTLRAPSALEALRIQRQTLVENRAILGHDYLAANASC